MVKSGGHAVAASTRDASAGGLFLYTDVDFRQGAEIEVALMIPELTALPFSGMVCCHGKVVRVERNRNQYGLATKIVRVAQRQA